VFGTLPRDSDEPEPVAEIPPQRATSGDSVAGFGQDFKERLLAGPYRSVTAFADNYGLTGVSRSTTYAAISGTRLPSEGTVDKLLATVVGADRAEIQIWLTRRSALETGLDAAPDSGRPEARTVRRLRLRDVAVLAIGLAVVAAGASAAIAVSMTLSMTHHQSAANPAPTSVAAPARSCSPTPDLRTHQVAAHVANTQGEGTYARITPQTPCHTGFLSDGEPITVVCQDLHGPVITDVYDGSVRNWPVWDKLGSGAYVSDLYVDLPKRPSPALVDQLPGC
jgi:predicted DNA-binding transcriptional regulator AlpA